MDGYLDEVTGGKVRQFENVYRIDIDSALKLIRQRRNQEERLALLTTLSSRLHKWGESKGYVESSLKSGDPNHFASFIVEDILGIDGSTAEKKSIDKLKDITKEYVLEHFNATGKKAHKFSELVWDLINCTSSGEAARVLGKAGWEKFNTWAVENRVSLAKSAMKKINVPKPIRNRIVRVLALRTSLLKALPRFAARLNPILLAVDIFLTPGELASSRDEERLEFANIYSKIIADQSSIFSDLMKPRSGFGNSPPVLRYPLGHVIQSAIATSH
jgi:hypothetical protein